MKKTIISGILALLFLGSLFFAQATADIAVRPLPPSGVVTEPVPPIPPGLIEARYYEGEAVVRYNNVWIANGNGKSASGIARVWVERDVFRNLFRGRYEICYNTDGPLGVCEAITTTGWMEGRVLQYWDKAVWIIGHGSSVARLGPEDGFVKLYDGRMTITMNLKLKQPVIAPEPIPPIEVAPTAK